MKHPASKLSIHPLLKALPALPAGHPEFCALVASIKERGIDYPILITEDDEIVDGRHRWMAAKSLGLESVPVAIANGDPAQIVLGSLLERRHYSQGAKAYLAIPLLLDFLKESNARRLRGLKKEKSAPPSNEVINLKNIDISSLSPQATTSASIDQVADRLGLGRDSLFRASKLHAIYAKDPEYKEETEPKLLAGEVGLGALIAGHAGRRTTAGKGRVDRRPLELWAAGVWTLFKRWEYWSEGDAAGQKQAWEMIRERAAELSVEEAGGLADWMVQCAGELRKRAKTLRVVRGMEVGG